MGVVTAAVLWLATAKLRHADSALSQAAPLPGAWALAAVTAGTMVLGAVAFIAVW